MDVFHSGLLLDKVGKKVSKKRSRIDSIYIVKESRATEQHGFSKCIMTLFISFSDLLKYFGGRIARE